MVHVVGKNHDAGGEKHSYVSDKEKHSSMCHSAHLEAVSVKFICFSKYFSMCVLKSHISVV